MSKTSGVRRYVIFHMIGQTIIDSQWPVVIFSNQRHPILGCAKKKPNRKISKNPLRRPRAFGIDSRGGMCHHPSTDFTCLALVWRLEIASATGHSPRHGTLSPCLMGKLHAEMDIYIYYTIHTCIVILEYME